VVASAELLQQDLQRAAATAGKDQTAAAALAALKEFRSTHVGVDRANSVRPLRTALQAEQRAQSQLAQAKAAHADYLDQLTAAERARQEAAAAAGARRTAERDRWAAARLVEVVRDARLAQERVSQLSSRAAELAAAAEDARRHYERARNLSAELGDAEPPGSPADEELARQVSMAVAAWRAAPEVPYLDGPSADQLQAELDALPEPPTGDQRPDAELRRLRDALDDATTVLDSTDRRRPAEPDVSDPQLAAALHAGPDVLRRLADRLSEQSPREDQGLIAAAEAAAADLAAARSAVAAAEAAEAAALESLRRSAAASTPVRGEASSWMTTAILVAAAALGALGLLLLLLGQLAAGAVALALGLAGVAAGFVVGRTPPNPPAAMTWTAAAERTMGDARRRLRDARDELGRYEFAYAQAQARAEAAAHEDQQAAAFRQAAVSDAMERGLPADPDALVALAARAAEAHTLRDAFARWAREHESDLRAQQEAARLLARALTSRGYDCSTGVVAAYSAYERDCAAAAAQAQLAVRRPDLTRRLAERRDFERRHASAVATRRSAVSALTAATAALGIKLPPEPGDDAAAAAADGLEHWLGERATALAAIDEQRGRWHDLKALLDGASLPELANAAAAKAQAAADGRTAAEQAAALVDNRQAERAAAADAAGAVATVDEHSARALLAERDAELMATSQTEREAEKRAAELTGQVAAAADCLSVAEAEEAVEQSARELQRLRALDEVLELTTTYMERAQNDVFGRMAPVLAGTLTRWLPQLTGGRYLEALVHPKTLRVRVREASGQWREANLLSVGTAEQVYLLLRVALAEHLATKSAVSPLLLDDVTVQADPTRTIAILEMCKALADEGRQVVLFAQETTVAEWAAQHLQGPQHRVIKLEPVPLA
jgi:hypothetical protein